MVQMSSLKLHPQHQHEGKSIRALMIAGGPVAALLDLTSVAAVTVVEVVVAVAVAEAAGSSGADSG